MFLLDTALIFPQAPWSFLHQAIQMLIFFSLIIYHFGLSVLFISSSKCEGEKDKTTKPCRSLEMFLYQSQWSDMKDI